MPTRYGLILLFGLSLCCLGAAAASSQQPSGDGLPSPGAAAEDETAPRIWWNQSRFVDALGLSEKQRADFDAILDRHMVQRRDTGRALAQARRRFVSALESEEWVAAEKAREELQRHGGAMIDLSAELTESVFRSLTSAQRAILIEEFPRLLSRPWIMTRGSRFGAGPGGRAPGRD